MISPLRMYTVLIQCRKVLLVFLFVLSWFYPCHHVNAQGLSTDPLAVTTVCAGSQLDVSGIRLSGAEGYAVELSDGGTVYNEIPSVFLSASGRYQIVYRATIPTNTPPGADYRVRLVSKSPTINGSPSSTTLTVLGSPTAALAGNQTIQEGQPASLSVVFSGEGPWTFSYLDSTATGLGTVQSMTATTSLQVLTVSPKKTTAYVLTSVNNAYCPGSLTTPVVTVTVNPLLATDESSLADALDVYPIPANTTLKVHVRELPNRQTMVLELTDLTGAITYRQETQQSTATLALDNHPTGTYILRVRVGERTAARRIVKH